ncbi:hypothetical protein QAD02_015512 [Eretmocerus hayati]|uniref:Uncharacterized protein n=1 Tax=Eretmocerus hayati TaxID=131215 RepID=A0ACC2PD75_9HYME|nr:hypothetical protein QAD02_015512 [Eretmocerus hayati]
MGGKNFYCEYCDRSFKDVAEARKKHLSSLQHAKNKNWYYQSLKDPEQILAEESQKKPCMKFINQGNCPWDILCRYSHYTPAQMQELQNMVAAKAQKSSNLDLPDPQQVFQEFLKDIIDPEEIVRANINPWPLPPELAQYPNLPPSLQPITYDKFVDFEFTEWGQR